MKTILVVDDEPKIATLARDYLEHAGFAVLTASDGPAALTTIRQRHPDLVVLDLGLPGLDGLDVTRELRRDSTIPIVMLTARDDELDKLLGLELGADDYLTKPFSPRELVARVRAVLRRADRPPEATETIHAGDVVLDLPRMRTEVAGTAVELTPTEFQLLATLAARPGPHLHPRPAARRAPRRRLRVVRARDRLAHQEPAPQARARPAPAALRPDGLRRGLPIRRRPGDRLMPDGGGRVRATGSADGRARADEVPGRVGTRPSRSRSVARVRLPVRARLPRHRRVAGRGQCVRAVAARAAARADRARARHRRADGDGPVVPLDQPDARRARRGDSPGRGRRLHRPGRGAAPAAAGPPASWPAASTRWPPGSRPTSDSDGRSWPRSATSCGRR